MTGLDVSIIVPLYNERENLAELDRQLRAAMAPTGVAYEVIYIDDGSTDGSGAELERLAVANTTLKIVRLRENRGQSAALAAGFRRASGPVVVTLDADLQNDPADIPALLEALEGCDVVSGVRARRRDTWLRRLSSRIANRVRSRVTGDGVTDVGCSLKAYRAEFLARVPMFDGVHRFLPGLVRMEGARLREIQVNHRPRLHGETKYSVRNRIFRVLADLAGVRWMQKRWIDRRLEEEVSGWNSKRSG